MLTDQRVRNGLIDTARHWLSREVPFFIDRVFSEYYNIKLQIGMRDVEGNIHAL